MTTDDDRLALQEAAEQGDTETETAAAKAETLERMKGLKNRAICLNGQKYGIFVGKPYPDDPKLCAYLLGTVGGGQGKTEFSLWNIRFLEGDKIKLWPYNADNSEALKEELRDDFLEHVFDDD